MKQAFKYIFLIIISLFFEKSLAQSCIYAKFFQLDTLCKETNGIINLYMYNSHNDNAIKVKDFRLLFEFDSSLLKIEYIGKPEIFLPNLTINYPTLGSCEIIDTLSVPNNFYYPDADSAMNIAFQIKFRGLQDGNAQIRFNADSCYFYSEEGEQILAFFQDSPTLNIKTGYISFDLQQTGKGCSYEEKGQAEVKILEGTPPYSYKWNKGTVFFNTPYRAGALPAGEVGLVITDGNGCLHHDTIDISIFKAPQIEWTYTPEVTVKEYPIHFEVTNLDDGYNWQWKIYYNNPDTNVRDSIKDLGDRANKTDFTYVFLIENDYEVQLRAQSRETNCDTTITQIISIVAAELEFKNVVTPGNNRFKIKANGDKTLADVFLSHSLVIQDRTGRKVYQTTNFPDEGWDGNNNPNGVYYFILKAKSTRKEYKYQGTVTLLGGNK